MPGQPQSTPSSGPVSSIVRQQIDCAAHRLYQEFSDQQDVAQDRIEQSLKGLEAAKAYARIQLSAYYNPRLSDPARDYAEKAAREAQRRHPGQMALARDLLYQYLWVSPPQRLLAYREAMHDHGIFRLEAAHSALKTPELPLSAPQRGCGAEGGPEPTF